MAALSCFLAAVLEKLDSVLGSLGFMIEDKKSVSLLKKLRSVLQSISDEITDAEENQPNKFALKYWLQDLEEALYDAEDVLDEILYENTRIKLEAESLKLKDLARRLLPAYTKRSVKRGSSLQKTLQVIDAIANRKGELRSGVLIDLSGSYTFPFINTSQIYGRNEDKLNVLELLLHGDKNLDAIALIGMGGSGKTTLAKLVYNDERVDAHFDLKVWVSVGFHFDVHGITTDVLAATGFSSPRGSDQIQALSDRLYMKRFLLVLDDVWNEDSSKWQALESSLKPGWGSRIIVTTRMDIVADVMGCSARYLLRPLTTEDCWKILENSAFQGMDRAEVKAPDDIGRRIAEKCGGLPLIAREIGGLLRSRKSRQEWHNVLNDLETLSYRTGTGSSILKILESSYYHLSAQLKRCFAYCSLFPKGYEFDMEELVLLWIAEGFLQQSTSVERVGAECFNGLLKRSFFIPVDNSRFIMHDLMHFLSMSVSHPYFCKLEPLTISIPTRARHLSLERSQYYNKFIFTDLSETNKLRTFYVINSPSCHDSRQLSTEAWKFVFTRPQRLRVLKFPHFQHAELPDSIRKLKYLRHLDVSDSALERLPRSLCILYHLQTLILTNCSALSILPKGIVKLVDLRKLQIKGTGLKQMPEEIGRLTSLQSLSNFIVGHSGSSIKELGALPHLHGSLSVSELQNVSSASDASAANLKTMQYLDELELEWSRKSEDPSAGQEEVLENLTPSVELKKLSIRFYGGRVFPNWLGDSSSLSITCLYLGYCRNCESLPPLGQLSLLEHLTIEGFSGIRCIGSEFYGVEVSGRKPFLSLKTLKLGELSQWEDWTLLEAKGEEYFTRLEEFYIINCPLFVGDLPKSLPALKKLEIAECEKLAASLPWTSEGCILKVDTSYKVHKKTEDKIMSKGDGEPASQFSSSMTQTPGNGLQLESNGTNKSPADKGAVEDDLVLSGKLEKPSMGSYDDKEFLQWLEFFSLSKLTSLCISDNNICSLLPPLGQLPFLEHLIIQRMGGVRSIGPEFYRLGFPFRKPFQSLKTLKFEAMSQWELWATVEVEGEEFPCLREFYIINCPKLKGDLPKSLPSLIKLEISECQQLAAVLPLTSKRCLLTLKNCDKVQRITDDDQAVAPEVSPSIMPQKQDDNREEPISGEDGNQQFPSSSLNDSNLDTAPVMEQPTDLHSLRIERFSSNMLPKQILERSSLHHLYIIDCINLKTFPLSPSLKTLYIHNCPSLEFPQPNKVKNQDVLLEDLCLGSSCDSLRDFPLNYFPKLKALSLWDCRNLESLSIDKELQAELSLLESLEIKDCPNFRSLLEEECQAPNLTSLVFFNCGCLKSLQWMQSFKSLQSLYINKCPELESLPGLPSRLVILCISFCDKINPQKEWKLVELHSLCHFEIEGGCLTLESFPEEGLLPTNLNSLRINRLPNLTSLDEKGLQGLTSLQTIEINCCDKLDSLAEHGMPSSLSSLSITDCSLLNPKLQSRKGKEWFKIAHIPSIHLDELSD